MIRRGELSAMQALSLSFQASLAMMALVFLSQINLHAFGLNLTAIFLPFAAIYLWPFRAHYGWSLFGVWLCGLLQDIVMGGTMGLFGLVYCLIFMGFNPTERQFAPKLRYHWGLFGVFLCPALLLTWLLGAPASGQFTSFWQIAAEGIRTLILFPLVYGARQFIRRMITGETHSGVYL